MNINTATTTQHGAMKGKMQTQQVEYYNLDVIISVGYRVKSMQGPRFRIWATNVLRDYSLKGYPLNQRVNRIENRVEKLAKKVKKVKVILFTKIVSKQLTLDVKKVNEQYGNFEIKSFTKSHDRFLIIDNREVYHLGASLKDLGKKWFAFSKMDKNSVETIIKEVEKCE
ncbi:MAG TPA: RhuM family protein [Bacteroidales bacterium]|nr:RhuM family protein [Bacteroidales bacterium]HQA86673.1 RhuM family protein [Bacteroidales bacterium]